MATQKTCDRCSAAIKDRFDDILINIAYESYDDDVLLSYTICKDCCYKLRYFLNGECFVNV